jgi:hypothetical protein
MQLVSCIDQGGRKAKLVTYSQDLKILDKLQEEAVTAKRNRFTSALKDAIAQGSCVATKEQWLSGEHADAIVHLIEFAKEEVAQPHSDALFALMDTGYEVSADGGALLLKRIGIWPRHIPNIVVCLHIELGTFSLPHLFQVTVGSKVIVD